MLAQRGDQTILEAREALRLTGLPADDHCFVTAHLGNGCSAAAVKNGKSVAGSESASVVSPTSNASM